MRQLIEKYFTTALIVILVLIILLQRSCSGKIHANSVVTHTDTVWKTKVDTVLKTVTKVSKIHIKVPSKPEFEPGNNLDTCKVRLNTLSEKYMEKTIYIDTLKLDNLGTVQIIDTVWQNQLYGKRRYIKDIQIPTVEKTITITKDPEPVRQVYIGGSLFGDKTKLQLINPGILYKTKKDHIYQVGIGINFNGTMTYNAGAYWKISFKK
jgi:hypothetical protein